MIKIGAEAFLGKTLTSPIPATIDVEAPVLKPVVQDNQTQTELTLLRMQVYSNNSHSPKNQINNYQPTGQEDFMLQNLEGGGGPNFKMMMKPMFAGSRVSLLNRP